ncbi:hypothetical protein BpHYR1_010089 [Brachionus plicatilis]|uniref:Uncharacterized protein n=1 Tax=Brachionus plicatilis TaxID=10195 RepID=A0A3M7QSV1_BRAPC|nr:hypothetical protein BpHYR1_010089 [Brachionus plicatilis]
MLELVLPQPPTLTLLAAIDPAHFVHRPRRHLVSVDLAGSLMNPRWLYDLVCWAPFRLNAWLLDYHVAACVFLLQFGFGMLLSFVSLKIKIGPEHNILVGLSGIKGTSVQFAQVVRFEKVLSQLIVVFVVLFNAIRVTKVAVIVVLAKVTVQFIFVKVSHITIFTCRMALKRKVIAITMSLVNSQFLSGVVLSFKCKEFKIFQAKLTVKSTMNLLHVVVQRLKGLKGPESFWTYVTSIAQYFLKFRLDQAVILVTKHSGLLV